MPIHINVCLVQTIFENNSLSNWPVCLLIKHFSQSSKLSKAGKHLLTAMTSHATNSCSVPYQVIKSNFHIFIVFIIFNNFKFFFLIEYQYFWWFFIRFGSKYLTSILFCVTSGSRLFFSLVLRV